MFSCLMASVHLLSLLHLQTKSMGPPSCARDIYYQLIQGASDCRSHARLLAAAAKESGAWLLALPVSSLGLRMDDHTSCWSSSRYTTLSAPHLPTTVEVIIDALATYRLSCNKSQGCFSCHAAINAIIHRSLAAVNVPSTLASLAYADHCPMEVWPLSCMGRYLCGHTYAATHTYLMQRGKLGL